MRSSISPEAVCLQAIYENDAPLLRKFLCAHKSKRVKQQFWNRKNRNGLTPLLSAVTLGNLEVVQLLLSAPQVDINTQDDESGWTALHKALYHGFYRIAHCLLDRPGIDLFLRDHDGQTAFELYESCHQRPWTSTRILDDADEVVTWEFGSTRMVNRPRACLPVKLCPVLLARESLRFGGERWKSARPQILHIALGRSMSAIITPEHLYLRSEKRFSLVREEFRVSKVFPSTVRFIAFGTHHSVIIDDKGDAWTWGNNSFGQTGHPCSNGSIPVGHMRLEAKASEKLEHLARPKRLEGPRMRSENFLGAAASGVHTVLYTLTRLITFGLNQGQLGLASCLSPADQEKYYSIQEPQDVADLSVHSPFLQVCANDIATTVLTSRHEVLVLEGFAKRRVRFLFWTPPGRFVFTAKMPKAHVSHISSAARFLTVTNDNEDPWYYVNVAISNTGDVHLWVNKRYEATLERGCIHACLLWQSRSRFDRVIDASLGADGILVVCTHGGRAYTLKLGGEETCAGLGLKTLRLLFSRKLSPDHLRKHRFRLFTLVQGLHNIRRVFASPFSEVFAAIQRDQVVCEGRQLVLDMSSLLVGLASSGPEEAFLVPSDGVPVAVSQNTLRVRSAPFSKALLEVRASGTCSRQGEVSSGSVKAESLHSSGGADFLVDSPGRELNRRFHPASPPPEIDNNERLSSKPCGRGATERMIRKMLFQDSSFHIDLREYDTSVVHAIAEFCKSGTFNADHMPRHWGEKSDDEFKSLLYLFQFEGPLRLITDHGNDARVFRRLSNKENALWLRQDIQDAAGSLSLPVNLTLVGCDGARVYTNTSFLVPHSKYLQTLFNDEWKGSLTCRKGVFELDLRFLSSAILDALISWYYGKDISQITRELASHRGEDGGDVLDFVCNLMDAAVFLMLDNLTEACEVYLETMIDSRNALYLCARSRTSSSLRHLCVEYLLGQLTFYFENGASLDDHLLLEMEVKSGAHSTSREHSRKLLVDHWVMDLDFDIDSGAAQPSSSVSCGIAASVPGKSSEKPTRNVRAGSDSGAGSELNQIETSLGTEKRHPDDEGLLFSPDDSHPIAGPHQDEWTPVGKPNSAARRSVNVSSTLNKSLAHIKRSISSSRTPRDLLSSKDPATRVISPTGTTIIPGIPHAMKAGQANSPQRPVPGYRNDMDATTRAGSSSTDFSCNADVMTVRINVKAKNQKQRKRENTKKPPRESLMPLVHPFEALEKRPQRAWAAVQAPVRSLTFEEAEFPSPTPTTSTSWASTAPTTGSNGHVGNSKLKSPQKYSSSISTGSWSRPTLDFIQSEQLAQDLETQEIEGLKKYCEQRGIKMNSEWIPAHYASSNGEKGI